MSKKRTVKKTYTRKQPVTKNSVKRKSTGSKTVAPAKKKKKLTEAEQDRAFEKAEKVLDRHYKKILCRKGVQAVEVNNRIRNGKMTDEIVICIHVEKKVNTDELPDNQRFTTIQGIPVDVVESRNTYEPLSNGANPVAQGGDKIAPTHNPTMNGTLGIVCFDQAANSPMFLTNAHVVFGNKGKASLPSRWGMLRVTGSNSQPLGAAIKSKAFRNSNVDYAVIEPDVSINPIPGVPGLLPVPKGIGVLTRADARQRVTVQKLGQKTGATSGELRSITMRFTVPGQLTFVKQIAIVGVNGNSFSAAGDSGSVVIYKDKVVGLIHGVTNSGQTAIACHMEDVARQLNIQI